VQIWKAVSNLLFYVTFSANMFLYCLSGDRFRSTLRHVLLRCCWCGCEGTVYTTAIDVVLTVTTGNFPSQCCLIYSLFFLTTCSLFCLKELLGCSALFIISSILRPDNEHVCVSVCVCLSAIMSSERHVRSSPFFCACYLWPWLDPLLAA